MIHSSSPSVRFRSISLYFSFVSIIVVLMLGLDLRGKFKQLQKDLSPKPRPFYGFVTTVIVRFFPTFSEGRFSFQ